MNEIFENIKEGQFFILKNEIYVKVCPVKEEDYAYGECFNCLNFDPSHGRYYTCWVENNTEVKTIVNNDILINLYE